MTTNLIRVGFWSGVTANARGVFGIVTVRLPDLCNPPIPVNPNGSLDSGSTVYMMLTNYGDGVGAWYRIGYYRIPGKSCPHVYMQWRLSASSADIPAADRFCQMCNPQWLSGRPLQHQLVYEQELRGLDGWVLTSA